MARLEALRRAGHAERIDADHWRVPTDLSARGQAYDLARDRANIRISIAISNRRLLSADENGVTFKYKDYRIEGPARYKTMTLATDEFIRRFLIHVLPKGFHRIRHCRLQCRHGEVLVQTL